MQNYNIVMIFMVIIIMFIRKHAFAYSFSDTVHVIPIVILYKSISTEQYTFVFIIL